MDPVSAFSLAGTILQFIDSGTRFANLAWNVHQRGPDDADDSGTILKINKDLNAVLPELETANRANISDREQRLNQLAQDCGVLAKKLLSLLTKIKDGNSNRKRDALKTAIRKFCKEDEIKSLNVQLATFRDQFNLHLLLSLRCVTRSFSYCLCSDVILSNGS